MFSFSKRRPKDSIDPLQSQRSAIAWLREIPAHDTLGRHQLVIREFDEMSRSGRTIDSGCVSAIELLDAELASDRGQLIRQYVDTAHTQGVLAERIWTAAYDTSQAFIRAYRQVVDEAVKNERRSSWRRVMPRLFARLIHFYGTDAKLRVLRNERWIPAKWLELHALYRQATDLGIERVPLGEPTAETAPRTVEQEYVAVLLMHLLNTGTLSPAEIEWAGAQTRAWSRGLTLDAAPGAAGGFCVDIAGRGGLVRRSEATQEPSVRYLDTAPLADQIALAVTAHRRRNGEQSVADSKAQQRINTLDKLRPALAPDANPGSVRAPRVRRGLAAVVRIGLTRILQERGFHNDNDDAFAASSWKGARAREAPGSATAEGGAVVDVGESAWRVEDSSPNGMRLKSSLPGAHGVALGTLMAVHDPAAVDWLVGIVRRLNRSATEVEAGLAIIARRACAVALNVKRHARADMSIVVDGVDSSIIGARFDALYLPPPSRPENPIGARTLIVPTTEFADGRQLMLVTAEAVYTLALKKVIEQRPDWTWAAMEIVEKVERSAAST